MDDFVSGRFTDHFIISRCSDDIVQWHFRSVLAVWRIGNLAFQRTADFFLVRGQVSVAVLAAEKENEDDHEQDHHRDDEQFQEKQEEPNAGIRCWLFIAAGFS